MSREGTVCVTHKMVGVPVFDEDVIYHGSDQLFVVGQRIMERHGGTVQHLRLWRDKVEPTTILRDLRATIADTFQSYDTTVHCGRELPHVTIYYDFDAARTTCPLLRA